MSPMLDSVVQTQMAVGVFSSSLRSEEYHGTNRMEGKPTGSRHAFVQTEMGCLLCMELERNDNAHTVKRRLQLALNFPIDGSSLTFGDMVLKNDLNSIHNDSPLSLTRNLLYRSSSTPCLSPTCSNNQQRDQSSLIEILGHSTSFAKTKQLVKEVVRAMKNGVNPIPTHGGLGGSYYFRNNRGEKVAIVKPLTKNHLLLTIPRALLAKLLGNQASNVL